MRWILKWGVIGAAITIASALIIFIALSRFADTSPDRVVRASAPTVEQQGQVGGRAFSFLIPDERIPHGEAEELAAPPITLIAERQQNPLPPVVAPDADIDAFATLAREFVGAYETFRPDQPASEYSAGFAALVGADRLAGIASREDSHAPPEVGICEECTTGSQISDAIDPGLYVTVRRYDSRSAYITTQAVVRYTGQGASAGSAFRRSYALILSHASGRWLVSRVASDTLAAAPRT